MKKIILKKRPAEDPQWYFFHEGVEFGPMGDDELCKSADMGLILPTDEVRRTDLPHSITAVDVKGLFGSGVDYPSELQEGELEAPLELADGSSLYQPDVIGSGSVTCVHCWYKFDPEDVLFIACHPDLAGDPILGPDEHQRFLPSRFTPEGHAIDSEGLICPEVACPRCHMRLPRSLLSMKPLFLSLVGAPASGKSYFLASMSWQLRTTLPEKFLISFSDADGAANQWLSDYEELLFVQASDDSLQAIDKTQLRGDLYREVMFGGMRTSLPLPSVFNLQAEDSSIFHREANHFVQRSLVLYDNAGEHFEPGRDSATDPGTQHLLHSEALIFMLDPTKSPKFRKALSHSADPQLTRTTIVQRQDTIFTETLNRIRLHMGIDGKNQYRRPVVVLLSKADLFGGEVAEILQKSPWRWEDGWQAHCLDVGYLMQASFTTRHLISQHNPEVVQAIEGFAQDVVYLPVSALGCSPIGDPKSEHDVDSSLLLVRTGDIRPAWVEVPLLYVLFKLGYVGGIVSNRGEHPEPDDYEIRGGMYHFIIPGTSRRVRLPLSYASFALRDPESGVWFQVPANDNE